MRALTKKELILGCICMAIAAAFLINFSRKMHSSSISLHKEIAAREAELARLIQIYEEGARLESVYAKTVAANENINDATAFISALQTAAQKSGFDIQDIKPDGPEDEDLLRYYSALIEGRSSIAALSEFLIRCKRTLKAFDIETLTIRKERNDNFPTVLLRIGALSFNDIKE